MSRLVTKPTKWHVCRAKTQISRGIHVVCRPVWSESLLCAQWVAKETSFLQADSEDSDQTGWMPRLIWVFAGRTCHFVGFVTRRLKCHYFFWSWHPLETHPEDWCCFECHVDDTYYRLSRIRSSWIIRTQIEGNDVQGWQEEGRKRGGRKGSARGEKGEG